MECAMLINHILHILEPTLQVFDRLLSVIPRGQLLNFIIPVVQNRLQLVNLLLLRLDKVL